VVEPDVQTSFGAIDEDFTTALMKDDEDTSAQWGSTGLLKPQAMGFGDGSDGDFAPEADIELDTSLSPYQFASVNIPGWVRVTAVGDQPLELLVQGEVVIEGELSANGGDGEDALGVAGGNSPAGGKGQAGGGDGGDGSPGGVELGFDGFGTGGGQAGEPVDVVTFVASGGGGGYGAPGDDGSDWSLNNQYAGVGGNDYGDEELATILGGSGGGGGGPLDNTPGDPAAFGNGVLDTVDKPGAGGGAGGGAVVVRAGGQITLTGKVTAVGGDGGMGDFSGGGGGGSGGAVLLETAGKIVFEAGLVSASGGKGNICTDSNQLKESFGGDGAGGRIVLRTGIPLTEGIVLDPDPIPHWGQLVDAIEGGDGSDGAFAPLVDVELNTDSGPFYYTSVSIPEGVTVTASGSQPLQIYSQGNVDILGILDVSGDKGGTGFSACCTNDGPPVAGDAGMGGPGGYAGGAGSPNGAGGEGLGPGGGAGSSVGAAFSGGGGGGGFGTAGQVGGCPEEASGGEPYGSDDLTPLEGGSGGGGAGYNSVAGDNPGSGGGGGGGAVLLQTSAAMLMSGTLRSNGGEGGDGDGAGTGGSFGAGGGGGSGGAILVRAASVRYFGIYEAIGGIAGYLPQGGGCSSTKDVPGQGRGGRGGKGKIRFETSTPLGFVYKQLGSLFLGAYEALFGTTAVSLFYDTGVECPDYLDPQLEPAGLGSAVTLSFEGAHDLGGAPDPASFTGWQLSPDEADCHRYLRFKVEFKSWPASDQPPALDNLAIPFSFDE